jgi:hypothetical protein
VDPNDALDAIREAIRHLADGGDEPITVREPGTLGQLAENFTRLDEWLSDGGALPAEWTEAPESVTIPRADLVWVLLNTRPERTTVARLSAIATAAGIDLLDEVEKLHRDGH